MSIAAIVLAGDREASKNILGRNKAFLELSGKPIFFYVLAALEEARQVDRIILVGPKYEIEEHLKHWHFKTPIVVIEQRENVYENAWNGFLHSLPGYADSASENLYEQQNPDHSALFVSADIPVVVGLEIDQFISAADMKNFDVVMGVTRNTLMKRYLPTRNRPGIRMTFFHLKEFSVRQSNIILAKPFQIKNRAYFRLMYAMRHQRNFLQMVKLGWTLIQLPESTPKILLDYLLLHLNMVASIAGFHSLLAQTRRLVSIKRICKHISALLGTRFCVLENQLGGALLDIDNERDYRAMAKMFNIWKSEQRRLGKIQHAPMALPPYDD